MKTWDCCCPSALAPVDATGCTALAIAHVEAYLTGQALGPALSEAKEIIDMYDSPRDTGPQLRKFLAVLAEHRRELEEQMADLLANLDEVKVHEKEAKALLAKVDKAPVAPVS